MARILLVSSNSSDRGGGERYLDYLTQGLRQTGHEVHILLSDHGYMDGWAKMFAGSGATIHRAPLKALRHRKLRFLQSMAEKGQQRRIAELCRSIAPDGILVNQQYDEDAIDYIDGAVQSGCGPVIATLHMPMTADKDSRPLGNLRGRLLRRWYAASPHRILYISEGGKAEFEDYYGLRNKGGIVHHGTTFADYRKQPRARRADEPVTVGFVGQFVPQKNLELLAKGWLLAWQKSPRFRLMLIGDGPERPAVEAILRAAPAESWKITGWVADPMVHFPDVDIYSMTSHFEGLPLALIEAAGMGLPGAVTHFNGAADIAARAPWLRVVDPTPEAVAQCFLAMAGELESLERLAAANLEAFRGYFSLERMARDTVDFLFANTPAALVAGRQEQRP